MNAYNRIFLLCLALMLFLKDKQVAAQTWREVDSPHFKVITDGSDRDGRNVAKEFEQMRSLFANRFKNANLETGAPLLIVAVQESGLHALSPGLWKNRDRFAGIFFRHWESQYALIRLDTFGDHNQAVVFHEYTQSVLHANLHWLPAWLEQGLAEYYGYTRFEAGRIVVGAPSPRLQTARMRPLLPIMDLLKARNSITHDADWSERFYADSWAVVHFMTFGSGMDGGAKLERFIQLLEDGTAQIPAFEKVFGDPKKFEDQLYQYLLRLTTSIGLLPPLQTLDSSSFPAKTLSPAEADYALGSFEIGAGDPESGRSRLEAAEQSNPALAGPHEQLGFLLWRQGKDEAAREEWKKAVEADSYLYRSAFALLMSETPVDQLGPQKLLETQEALQVLEGKAPKFAPIPVELALVDWRLGQVNQAYQAALIGEKLEPWRAGYHLLLGDILLAGHQPKLAADYARLVATRWTGADYNEAIDLWNAIPAADRGEPLPFAPSEFPDATMLRGTIVSSSCEKVGDKNVLHIALQPDVPQVPVLNLTSAGRYESGFSDTLWMGEDHYTRCFHLAGLPAVVGYKTVDGKQNLEILNVRDHLPVPATTAVPALPGVESNVSNGHP